MNFIKGMFANWGWSFPKQPALYLILGAAVLNLVANQLGGGLGGDEFFESLGALIVAFLTRGSVSSALKTS